MHFLPRNPNPKPTMTRSNTWEKGTLFPNSGQNPNVKPYPNTKPVQRSTQTTTHSKLQHLIQVGDPTKRDSQVKAFGTRQASLVHVKLLVHVKPPFPTPLTWGCVVSLSPNPNPKLNLNSNPNPRQWPTPIPTRDPIENGPHLKASHTPHSSGPPKKHKGKHKNILNN